MKLFLDENLSPRVAATLARENGVDVCHVRDRGMLSANDSEVLERAFEEDRILITANVADFERLAHARELHPGIVLLENGVLSREEQLIVLRKVLEKLMEIGDLVNRVLRVAEDGTMTTEAAPKP